MSLDNLTAIEPEETGPLLLAGQEKGGIQLGMRKRYDKEFKTKVALEALKVENAMQELAIIHSIHPNMIAL